MNIHKGFIILIASALAIGCGAAHHQASASWEDGRVRFAFTPTTGVGIATVNCVSCNAALMPLPLELNEQGVGYLKFDELRTYLSARFKVKGNGIDTALLLLQPPPEEAMKMYGLTEKLIGRILITRLAKEYGDTTMSQAIATLERQDELNIFGDDEIFYHVHDPRFTKPVFVLKSQAVRIQ
ncbi:MAG: hypothetical protein WCH46_01515 [bacterium]